jgi:SpoIID/LytB domain protein
LLVLAGSVLQKIMKTIKSPDRLRGFFIPSNRFLLLSYLLLSIVFWNCARQVHKPPQSTEVGAQPNIKVCLDENFSRATLSFDGDYSLQMEEAIYYFDKSIGDLNVQLQENGLIISNDVRYLKLSPTIALEFQPENPSATFIWNGTTYSGNLLIHYENGYLCAINLLPVESYLRGVVPFEIPTGQDEYRDAVYAQTIAARTYSLYRIEHPSGKLFHVYADVRDQVYNGQKRTTDLADEAIEKTIGIVLLDRDKPAFSQYHSTCGGILQDTLPSLRRDLIESQYNCALSPLFRWVEIRSAETIFSNLVREFNIGKDTGDGLLQSGLQIDLSIKDRDSDGRVTSVEADIPNQTFTAGGYRIRRMLSDEAGRALPSNFFFILKPDQKEEKFYIIGAGYGHGKGMCQWGALGMSLEGYSYQKILEFYYPSFYLKPIYTKQQWLF